MSKALTLAEARANLDKAEADLENVVLEKAVAESVPMGESPWEADAGPVPVVYVDGADKPSRRRRMKLNRKRRYPTSLGGEAEAEGVLSTMDVFGLYPGGEIGRMRIDNFLKAGTILYGHDADRLPIGRATWLEFTGDAWNVGWKWAENAFAQDVRAEWDAGMLVAMSVGLSVRFDEDFEIDDVALREGSVVPVGADEGAVVASIEGPARVLAELGAFEGEGLTLAQTSRLIQKAASMRSLKASARPPQQEEAQVADEKKSAEQAAAAKVEELRGEITELRAENESLKKQLDAALATVREASKPHGQPSAKAAEAAGPGADFRAKLEAKMAEHYSDIATPPDASDDQLMQAALDSDLTGAELVEAFAADVGRRDAAKAAFMRGNTKSETAKAKWEQANGESRGAESARQEMIARTLAAGRSPLTKEA